MILIQDSAVLSDANKGALNALIDAREGMGTAKASVAVWSDEAFPAEGAKLSRGDIELARQRADAVVKHLESLSWIGRTTLIRPLSRPILPTFIAYQNHL